ncbi:MAG: PaaI family thioesterase, partial [Akkermansiaceae bacterium]|nr:PaaI family thioesterase [Akkermansiaceae bacterium]
RIFVPTLELKVSFLAPARQGRLFAEGRVVKAGRTIAFLEADLFDGDGKHLARMSTTAAPRAIEMPTLVERK